MANPKSAPASASRCCLRLLFLAGFTAAPAPAQIAFTDLEPRYGLAGSEAALFGSGFPETGPLVVRVGGADAVLLERTGQLIRFTIPPAATSGSVSITAGEAVYRFPAPFTITRFISAQIAAELQAVTANHTVGTLYADATGPGPVQTLEVAKGEPTLVAASAGETDPVLLAIVTEADVSVVLNAQSTASALVFLTPGIQTPDHEEAAARLAFLASRPETSALASAIENRLAAGLEYLEHPAVEASTIALAEAFFAEYQPSAPAVSPRVQGLRDDFVGPVPALATGYPRDLEAPGY